MDVKKLGTVTTLIPIAYPVLVGLLGLAVLPPIVGTEPPIRLAIIAVLLAACVVPFSLWAFSTLARQHRHLMESAMILENVKDYAIFMLDPDGRVASWNPGAEMVKGFRADDVIGQHVSVFYPAEDVARGKPEENLRRALAEGRFEDEGWRVREDGTRFWANVVSTAVRDRHGNLRGFAHVTRDVTERKSAEERIRALNAELQERVAELNAANAAISRQNRELEAVNDAIGSLSRALDLPDVLQNIVDAARDLLQCRYAALGVADEQGRIVTFVTSGITPEQRAAIGPLPQGHGLLGALIQEATPLRIADIGQDPRSHGFPPNHPPMKSLLGVPIMLNNKPVGDLYLTDKVGADEFSEEDQNVLMLLSCHAAVAIQNARLYEEVKAARDRLQTWNEELETKVAERTREIERYSKEMTTRVLRAQEEERKRIARELHDETAQSLSTLLINLDMCQPLLPADNQALLTMFERIRTLVRRTLDETRALSHDLRPTILDDVGLAAAVQWFADEYAQTFGVDVQVDAEEPRERLSPEVEIALFRIAQEALTNSGKYAGATCVWVTLTFHDEVATLVVEDNGKGFDPEQLRGASRQGGLGMYGMQERAALLGGALAIDTTAGKGTRVTATVPVNGIGDVDSGALARESSAC